MYERVCEFCGSVYETPVNNTKFCPACRKKAYERNRIKDKVACLNDTEAMRQACLNCTRPRCGGQCEELARIARGEA